MDRKQQLRNVAFGGSWSERIADDEILASSLDLLERASRETRDRDLRGDFKIDGALIHAAMHHPKGEILIRSWGRALTWPNPELRADELKRIATLFREGLGIKSGSPAALPGQSSERNRK